MRPISGTATELVDRSVACGSPPAGERGPIVRTTAVSTGCDLPFTIIGANGSTSVVARTWSSSGCAHEGGADRRLGAQPRRQVHRVAEAGVGPPGRSADHPGEHPTTVEPGPHTKRALVGEHGERHAQQVLLVELGRRRCPGGEVVLAAVAGDIGVDQVHVVELGVRRDLGTECIEGIDHRVGAGRREQRVDPRELDEGHGDDAVLAARRRR